MAAATAIVFAKCLRSVFMGQPFLPGHGTDYDTPARSKRQDLSNAEPAARALDQEGSEQRAIRSLVRSVPQRKLRSSEEWRTHARPRVGRRVAGPFETQRR